MKISASLFWTVLAFASPPFAVAGAVAAESAAADPVPLYDDLGDHHHPITTSEPKTQQYFDQGLRLVYAFNHAEAIRAFEAGARLDPDCAMCYWGIALAYGPNINAPMDRESGIKAFAAVQKAGTLADRASAREQAYIRALTKRYAADPPDDRAALDAAYATAMGEVAGRYPDDTDAATLHAEALMDLSPWDYWTKDGRPHPRTGKILGALEGVIARNPNHPGACHYYIHAVEAAQPERAVPCAERLAKLMPGAGHLVHMPAHIYLRVGRYADAIESNLHAVHADEQYIADQQPQGLYPLAYYPHNYHFLAFAAAMAGRSKQAIGAARAAAGKVPPEVAAEVPELQGMLVYPQLTLVRFGRWKQVLAEPLPSPDLPIAAGLAHYARGVAFAAQRQWDEAQASLEEVQAAAQGVPEGIGRTVLEIADHSLAGEIAGRRGDAQAAVDHFTRAMRLEDSLQYMEPPFWYYPVRHSLGAALLQAGRGAEAEARYREDLKRFPENGWALYGLASSLRAQGKTKEAARVEGRFRKAWSGADVRLLASRF